MTQHSDAQREQSRGNGVAHAGQFGHQAHTPPADFDPGAPPAGVHAYPLSSELLDGEVTVSDDGEDQECVCGNAAVGDGYWLDADPDGKIDPDRQQSTDDADHAVCPKCGRVYENGALFEAVGSSAPAVARYDVESPEFQAARQAYEDEIF